METKSMNGKRVLLVEDDRAFREMLKTALQADTCTVTEANNGAEALGLFRKGRFDLVLVDLALPFIGGDELAVRIKQMAPDQPMLMLTGHMARRGPDCPVDAVLRKPTGFAQIRDTMANLLAETGGAVAA